MEIHQKFTEWAKDQGVIINGIAAHKFPGRGLGIIAEKDFKTSEILLTVPFSALRTAHTVPKSISRPLGPITVHGLLSTDLALSTASSISPWRSVLPTPSSFTTSMPLLWPTSLHSLLPSASKTLLENQQRKLAQDWKTVSKAFPQVVYEEYLYNWMVVNTRTFYFVDPRKKMKKEMARDDCMALNPFADYFNHSSHGCIVSFTAKSYTIAADLPITKGSEIYISYGNHSNDFLLTEYGFIMEDNEWDEIPLDEYIIPMFSESQKTSLKDAGFLGKYVLDRQTVCYRTQIALRILCLPVRKWRRFVDGLDDGEKDQAAVNRVLVKVLQLYQDHVVKMLDSLSKVDSGLTSQKETLSNRWRQINLLLETAIDRIQS